MLERLATGSEPDMADWLNTVALMTTHSKYFSAAEIKRVQDDRKAQDAIRERLIAEVHVATQ